MNYSDLPDELRRIVTACDITVSQLERAVLAASDREELWKARQELEGARKVQRHMRQALESVKRGLD